MRQRGRRPPARSRAPARAVRLGLPELASDLQRDGDRVTARMTGSADTLGTLHTIVEAEVRDGVVFITRIASGKHQKDETSVLELSATRMHPPAPR
jgi:hypothetical protein